MPSQEHREINRMPDTTRAVLHLAGEFAGLFEGDEQNVKFRESIDKAGYELFAWPREDFPPEEFVRAPAAPFPGGPNAWEAGTLIVPKGFSL